MYNFNPYYGQPMMPQPTPVQTIQQVQKTAQFYSVENAGELDGIKPALNVLYVGFNKKKKEIYLKQLTNDGLISVETYGLAEDKKEKTALDTVLDRITELERKLTNERNTANAGTEVPQRATSEPSTNATGQSNVAGQNPTATTGNSF